MRHFRPNSGTGAAGTIILAVLCTGSPFPALGQAILEFPDSYSVELPPQRVHRLAELLPYADTVLDQVQTIEDFVHDRYELSGSLASWFSALIRVESRLGPDASLGPNRPARIPWLPADARSADGVSRSLIATVEPRPGSEFLSCRSLASTHTTTLSSGPPLDAMTAGFVVEIRAVGEAARCVEEDLDGWRARRSRKMTVRNGSRVGEAAEGFGYASDESLLGRLESALKAPGPTVALHVPDVGFPSTAAARASLEFWDRLLRAVSEEYGLAMGPWEPVIPVVARPSECWTSETLPSECHPMVIAEALRPYRALDVHDRVEVIYTPLVRSGSTQALLTAITYAHMQLRELEGMSRGTGASEESLTEQQLSVVRSDAEQLVAGLPGAKESAGATDLEVFEAIVNLLNVYYDVVRNASFVMSLSWTLESQAHENRFQPTHATVVSAAGNDALNVYDGSGVDFVRLSENNGVVIGVANADVEGVPRCQSSFFTPNAGPPTLEHRYNLIAYFDGWVPIEGESRSVCGTSFAAPRVAWLLAAAQAASPGAAATSWPGQFRGRYQRYLEVALADASEPGHIDAIFDPWPFLSSSQLRSSPSVKPTLRTARLVNAVSHINPKRRPSEKPGPTSRRRE